MHGHFFSKIIRTCSQLKIASSHCARFSISGNVLVDLSSTHEKGLLTHNNGAAAHRVMG